MQITPYGVSAGFPEIKNIFRDPKIGQAFLWQYLKFIVVSLPGRKLLDEKSEQKILKFTLDIKDLVFQ